MNVVTQMLHAEDRTMKVADVITEMLHSVGVRRIYGVVGDSLNGITESLRQRGDIDWIHTRHEEAAAFAAGAEAHLTGELAVCAGSWARQSTFNQWARSAANAEGERRT